MAFQGINSPFLLENANFGEKFSGFKGVHKACAKFGPGLAVYQGTPTGLVPNNGRNDGSEVGDGEEKGRHPIG